MINLRWEGTEKDQYLFAGDLPIELAWLEKCKVQWSATCWLPGIDVGKEYNTLAAHQKNLAAKVEHWFQLAAPAVAPVAVSVKPAKDGEPVTLAECPVGLFKSRSGELCLKTEYGNNEGCIDAYIVSSGEFFWGDAPQTIASQRAQLVQPVLSSSIVPVEVKIREEKL